MDFRFQQYIGGRWCNASDGGNWDVINPATEEAIACVPFAGGADCMLAIEAAAQAFPAWAALTAWERGVFLMRTAQLLRERLDLLAPITVRESGKPLPEARGEWAVAADLFEWFAEEGKRAGGRTLPSRTPGKRFLVLRQPLGVVGVVTAWNFPVYNPARAWAAALAAGCTVVGRASEYTPMTAMALVNLMAEADFPHGVMNLVNGDPHGMGQAMLDHPALRRISFTGSPRVGRILMEGASRTLTRLGLELGGNAPVLIFPDADLDALIPGLLRAKFRNCGQVCVAPQRFLVHKSLHAPLVERLAAQVAALTPGDGFDPHTQVGPLINARQRDRVEAMMQEARDKGAKVLAGGARPDFLPRGYFYQPTLLDDVDPLSPLFTEEIFGPVLPVTEFSDFDEALQLANSTPYGLAAYVWTRDLTTSLRAAERLEFGLVGLNDWVPFATEAPFGGWKQSGMGHEKGREGLEENLETKLVAIGGL